jgi:hypothetical protein
VAVLEKEQWLMVRTYSLASVRDELAKQLLIENWKALSVLGFI